MPVFWDALAARPLADHLTKGTRIRHVPWRGRLFTQRSSATQGREELDALLAPGGQPPTHVKQRVVTLNHRRRRELEARAGAQGANGCGEVLQVCTWRGKQEICPAPVVYVRFLFAQRSFLSSLFEDGLKFCFCFVSECRVESRRTTSGTLICTLHP